MAIPTNTDYSFGGMGERCGGPACMQRAGAMARKTVEENTRKLTDEAVRKIMEAEASLKASAAIVEAQINRIVALELELASLKAAAKA